MFQLFNTLSQKKEDFIPIQEKRVSLYLCGITPYDTTHLGHAFTYITFDSLVRYLAYKGYQVEYSQNVTDINDRDKDILERAKEQNTSWQELAVFWTDKFLQDMQNLNWIKPTHYLWASREIPSMITLIQKIIANGYGYAVNGSVYLDITKYKRYGVLSRLSEDEMLSRAKEFEEDLENPEKKHPLDITLWRSSQRNQSEHIPSFESPFGPGRPGWHIECSSMSTSSLGEQIDIHGGGIDLIYPHHESELTQSETATGKVPFVRYWMHIAMVNYRNQKMSKSLGNLVMVSDLLKKFSPNAIRFVLLSHHYRTQWNFEEEEVAHAETLVSQLQTRLNKQENVTSEKDNDILAEFERTMDDDLHTPKALDLLRNALVKPSLTPEQRNAYTTIASTLGFIL